MKAYFFLIYDYICSNMVSINYYMKSNVLKLTFLLGLGAILLSVFPSCTKKGQISYPKSTNYGENIFNLASGELISTESYSLEANLTKKSTLTVVLTNLSETPKDPFVQKPRWVYAYVKGWRPDNVINDSQEFTTLQVGNNDMKLVFVGVNGSCKMDVFENGSAAPIMTKYFTWK